MPRVNRDLQRRMAARRERERRRPSAERRYRFGTTEPDLASEELTVEQELEDEVEGQAAEAAAPASRRATVRDGAAARIATPARASTAQPFAAYKSEYAYVLSDLRRVAVVVGSLLSVLILLYFILPR